MAAGFFLLLAPGVHAEGINVEYATSSLFDGSYRVEARIRFNFNDEILSALEHGVELNIDLLLRARRARKWIWDETIAEKDLHYTLQHHPLSEDYVVTEASTGQRHQFPSAKAAFKFVGSVNNLPLVKEDQVQSDQSYTGYIMARLNIKNLPAPLQPKAYVSKEWRMESPWYEWVIR